MAAKQTRGGRKKSPGTSSRSNPSISRSQRKTESAPRKIPERCSQQTGRVSSAPPKSNLLPREKPAAAAPPPRIRAPDEFPAMYNETFLRVLPRDPRLLFAFWEIAPDEFLKVKKTIPGISSRSSRLLLRLYEVNESEDRKSRERAVGDIIVGATTGSLYIPVPEPGRRYRVEYGIAAPKGRYVPLCRSKEVDVPAGRAREAASGPAVTAAARMLFDISARSGAVAPVPVEEPQAFLRNEKSAPPPRVEAGNSGHGSANSSRFIPY